MATTITAGNATNGAAISSDNTGILELKTGTGSGTTAMTVGTGQNVTFAQAANLPNTFGFKNRIINGDMRIDQRNAGASVTPSTGTQQYTLDRWMLEYSQTSKFAIRQNLNTVTPPAGFSNYLGASVSSAVSIGASDYFDLQQRIEGFNTADLAWGSANAQAVTVSFWVRSSLTGTFAGAIQNSSGNRSYVFTYSILAANTWEQKTITISGDTSGTWETNNSFGIKLVFSLGVGSTFSTTAGSWTAGNFVSATGAVSVVGTNGATFYITGVQLEKGSTATSFDYRPYGTELQLCQRYFEKTFNIGTAPADSIASSDRKQGIAFSATDVGYYAIFKVEKRANPTMVFYKGANAGTNGQWSYYNGASWVTMTTGTPVVKEYDFAVDFQATGRAFGQALILDGQWVASAEL